MGYGDEWQKVIPLLLGSIGSTSSWLAGIEPDYQTSQNLTGHGCFCTKLSELRLSTWFGSVSYGPVHYMELMGSQVNFGKLKEFAHSRYGILGE
ncbi:hypothetical protein EVAR_57059_1 [Eumeta japonica]|uniref:Uncharacterized protein n=1 Tax=Eumeta variegata TaxID=151549 RepID=A0A4C1YS59_EUMVA|nr:hypothetical protein EVAR_57059_1 [Eumeta japonica]